MHFYEFYWKLNVKMGYHRTIKLYRCIIMKKLSFVLVVLLTCILVFNVYASEVDTTKSATELREERIATAIENVWDKYDLASFQIGITDPIIWIGTEKMDYKKEWLTYLEKNVINSDLEHYNIEISERK